MADGFTPPQDVRSNAKRGLELRQKYNRGGTAVGVARARDLSNGASISLSTIKRMNSFFARHEVDKKGEGWGTDSAGYIAWLLWGGDAGWSWAKGILRDQEKKDKAMVNDFANGYAEIIKQEKQEDGTLVVYGKATDDSLDIDQQICDPAWLSTAMPEWFKTGGNIREQHSSIAAGVAKEYEAKSDGHYIQALVVDPISVKKVETGVLKGFSIGIKAPRVVRDQKAANGRIIDGQIVEVSLVDRPANPNAKLIMAKSVDGETTLVQVEEFIEKADDKTDYEKIIPERKGEPADKELYAEVIVAAKKKFDVYPSAVANAWVSQEYKKRGGKYSAKKEAAPNEETVIITTNEISKERNVDKSALVETILEIHKAANGDAVKFDQAAYDTARQALANLIIVEAGEMADGSDERDDIEELLDALKHLFNWYEGEADEGEAQFSDMSSMKSVEQTKGCDCDGCKACSKDGGCDSDPCDKCMMAKADKSVNKCLECGCHQVANAHGASTVQTPAGNLETSTTTANVSTANVMTPQDNAGSVKSAETTEEVVEEKAEETQTDILDEEAIAEIVEKAVKSATESVKSEIELLKAAKLTAEQKSVELEQELVIAKSAVVHAGPARAGAGRPKAKTDELLRIAAQYRFKAANTNDTDLVKGYTALAKDYEAKAGKSDESDSE